MKRYRYFLMAIAYSFHSPVFCQNYVKTETMLNESESRKTTSVQYYDGLGRPSLSATNSVNTSGKYVYRLQTYDHIGREYESWLPVVYYTNAFDLSSSMIENLSLSFYDDELAFQRNEYDALNRIVHIENGGEDWDNADRSIRKYYDTNSANSVIRFLAPLGVNSLQKNGYFPASTLTMEETEDENNLRTQVFKDLRGLTILERRISNSETFDTYFVYNDLGQLRYVVTPLYQTDPHKANNCYEYRYDNRGRMVKKILPQGGTIQYWYDSNNRPIYIKDAQGRHFFMLYDIHGRLVIEGSCSNVNYNAPSFTVTTQNAGDGFLGTGYAYSHPNAITHANIRKVYYYDNYNFLSSSLFSGVASSLTRTSPANATTFQTGSVLKNSDNTFIYQAIYYDDRGRAIETRQMMPEGRLLTSATSYSFTDKPDSTVTTLFDGTHQVSVTQRNEYSSGSDLLLKNSLQWGNGDITDIATYTYNDLGQLSSRQLGGNAGQVSYDYNLRGWLTHIGGSHFEEHLSYTDGPGTPQYGGSVSSLRWQVAGDNTVRGYKLSYDGLNRMTNAVYGEGTAISDNPNRYTEQITAYDKNGGILGLKRYGMLSNGGYGLIDDLSLTRTGNQVRSVSDNASLLSYTGAFNFTDNTLSVTGDEYLYYDDGSLMADANKGITQIRYDYYQNPIYISHTAGHIRESVYTPDGIRLRTVHRTAVPNVSVPFGSSSYLNASNTLSITTTDYVGNFIFENDTLTRYLFDGGYCTLDGYNSTPSYHFYERDHLGNNRVVVNESGAVEQITHYYPFGGIIADISTGHAFQPYKYNGKELDRMHGLDWYDYGARYYDAALGQFWRFDPLLEKYYPWNPYGYCADNPVNAVDPDGGKIIFVNGFLGLGSPTGGEIYWNGRHSLFVRGAQSTFNDYAIPYFTNYDFKYLRSSSKDREYQGYQYAKRFYKDLTKGMKRGVDKFNFISHSMGGAFSEGMIKFMSEQGWETDNAVFLNAWEPSQIDNKYEHVRIDVTSTNDPVQFLSIPLFGSPDIPSSDYTIRFNSDESIMYIHRDLIDGKINLWKIINDFLAK